MQCSAGAQGRGSPTQRSAARARERGARLPRQRTAASTIYRGMPARAEEGAERTARVCVWYLIRTPAEPAACRASNRPPCAAQRSVPPASVCGAASLVVRLEAPRCAPRCDARVALAPSHGRRAEARLGRLLRKQALDCAPLSLGAGASMCLGAIRRHAASAAPLWSKPIPFGRRGDWQPRARSRARSRRARPPSHRPSPLARLPHLAWLPSTTKRAESGTHLVSYTVSASGLCTCSRICGRSVASRPPYVRRSSH